MNVLMLLSKPYHTDPRVVAEARALVAAGHRVGVVYWDRTGGYPGEEVADGVELFADHGTTLMRLAPSDALRNPLWWGSAYDRAFHLHRSGRFWVDVVHSHDLDTLWAGRRLARRAGAKLVYDAHEIYGWMIEKDAPRPVVAAAFWLERRLAPAADEVITVNDAVADHLREVLPDATPVTIVANCKDVPGPYAPPPVGPFTVCYIGLLHASRLFPDAVEAVSSVPAVRFLLAGKKENLYADVRKRARGRKGVDWRGTVPAAEVLPLTLSSHLVLSMVDPTDRNNRIAWANKQFEAMAAGRPILASKGTAIGDFTEKHRVGRAVPHSLEGLAQGVAWFRDNPEAAEAMGRRAHELAVREWNWPAQAERLVAVYRRLEGDSSGPSSAAREGPRTSSRK